MLTAGTVELWLMLLLTCWLLAAGCCSHRYFFYKLDW